MPDFMEAPVEEIDNSRVAGFLNIVGLGTALAAFFVYIELLQAVQPPHWAGGSPKDWIETAQALGLYAAVIIAASLLLYGVTVPFAMSSSVRRMLSIAFVFLVALFVWTYLDYIDDEMPFTLRIGVPAALGGMLALVAMFAVTRVSQAGDTAILTALVIAGGTATLYGASLTHLMEPDRTERAITTSLLWVAVSAAGGMLIWSLAYPARLRWLVRSATAGVLCASFPILLLAQPLAHGIVRSNDQHNVLLITVDTLRADYCSTYGGPVPTPNLNALASRGALFERHYSLAPWTIPSINGLMSSKFPPGLSPGASYEERVREGHSYQYLAGYWLDPGGGSFPQRLGNLGYETATVFANPSIQYQRWLTQGFRSQHSVDYVGQREPTRFVQTPMLRTALARFRPEFGEHREIDSSAAVTEYGLSFLQQHRDGPFFLWLHFMDPHTPYDPPLRYRTRETPWPSFPVDPQAFTEDQEREMSDDDWSAAKSLYEAEIQYVDDCLGRILSRLRKLGLEQNTIVCFSSDHGEEFLDHGRWRHGHDLFDELVRVPLIFSGPRIVQDRIKEPVSSVDVIPTIAGLLDMDASAEWRGTSLAPTLFGGGTGGANRPVFSQGTHYFRYSPEPMQMVVDGNLKLIVGLESGTRRLFDLATDPGERTNLANRLPEETTRLQKLLTAWSDSFPSEFSKTGDGSTVSPSVTPEPEFEETLKALGYLQ